MTEKKPRFINKGEGIFQYGEWWCSAKGEHCADVIATAMNELLEENEQLKIENKHFRKVFGNKYDAYIDGKIGGNVNEL